MKYLLGVFAVVFVLVASIFWLLSSDTPKASDVSEVGVEFTDYADSSAKVIYEIRGELVSDEERQAVRVTVDRNQRMVEVLDGYQKKVINKKTYPNNSRAYEEFIFGLARAGFVDGKNARYETEKGVCPKGNITIYKVVENDEELYRHWGASCSRAFGNFNGDRGLVKDLFEGQIPDFREITEDVKL